MKKILPLAFVLILTIGVLSSCTQKQEEPGLEELASMKSNELNESQKVSFKRQIAALDDKSYDDLITHLVGTATNYKDLREILKIIEVDLSEVKVQSHENSSNLTLYASKRKSDTYYRLFAQYTLEPEDYNPGTTDLIIMYFDTSKADYYLYGCESNYTSLRSGQYVRAGTLPFNFYDDIALTNGSYAVIYITPKPVVAGKLLDFGAEWVHTFTELEAQDKGSANLDFGKTGLVSGSVGCSVTVPPDQKQWRIECVNTVRF